MKSGRELELCRNKKSIGSYDQLKNVPCNSEINSQLVGPPPTATKERRRLFSASITVGTAAFSKESIMLFRMALACPSSFKKKIPFPYCIEGMPNVCSRI
jgi:hypothetical protein